MCRAALGGESNSAQAQAVNDGSPDGCSMCVGCRNYYVQ
jgi:hypothetical protein